MNHSSNRRPSLNARGNPAGDKVYREFIGVVQRVVHHFSMEESKMDSSPHLTRAYRYPFDFG